MLDPNSVWWLGWRSYRSIRPTYFSNSSRLVFLEERTAKDTKDTKEEGRRKKEGREFGVPMATPR
ncbi:MAG: hypothetical protein EA343_20050 [Nodularia sp. (in: Bacteria)]|nr:MAG: hypothetical protein EA343_20050 [Nodularia sp. (in: cyanobacteria)]